MIRRTRLLTGLATALVAGATLAGCASDEPEAQVAALGETAERERASYRMPPLSLPPEFTARPDRDAGSAGTPAGQQGPTVFRRSPGSDGVPRAVDRIDGLSDGSAAFLTRVGVPSSERVRGVDRQRALDPALVDRLVSGSGVSAVGSGPPIAITRGESGGVDFGLGLL